MARTSKNRSPTQFAKRHEPRLGNKLLVDWLRWSGLQGKELAQMCGIDPVQIYHLTAGRRKASIAVAIRLRDATRGAIPIESWVEAA